MRDKLTGVLRALARTDLDSLISPVLLAIGAEQVRSGTGILTLGAALYLPLILDRIRRRAV